MWNTENVEKSSGVSDSVGAAALKLEGKLQYISGTTLETCSLLPPVPLLDHFDQYRMKAAGLEII